MKKLTSMLGLLAVAAGLTAAVAMAPAPEKNEVKTSNTNLYWFDANGQYEGTATIEQKQQDCGEPEHLCARGYDSQNPQPSDVPIVVDGSLN